MMLRKFNFPTVALHSMMKQVRGTTSLFNLSIPAQILPHILSGTCPLSMFHATG